jgi:glycine betaine/proline transport system substrate-binding protein
LLLNRPAFAKFIALRSRRRVVFSSFRSLMCALAGCACVLALNLATETPVLAQNVPALATPDISNLLAPEAPATDDAAPAASTTGDDSGAAVDTDQSPPPCGTQPISIASMSWPSAQLLAAIHARILKAQFDCTVEVLPSDIAPALSGMASTGQPAVAPEMWVDRVASQWNDATKAQKVRQVGVTYAENQFEGWFVPDYVMAAHPELKLAAALEDDWRVFAGDGKKGKFISCPADWACAVINRNLLKSEGLDAHVDVIVPKNRYDLDQTIAAAVSRKEPILFYYWQPNAVLAQFSFSPVNLGPYNQDAFACLGKSNCDNPTPSSFAAEPVVIAMAQWVFTDAPAVAAYFQRAQMPMDVMNHLLADLNAPGATVDSVADKFVAEDQDIWQKWVGTASAAKP